MEISDLTIRIFILIFPGIITAVIVDNLTVHTPWSNFSFTLYSIMFGFSSYLMFQIISFMIGGVEYVMGDHFEPYHVSFWQVLFDKSARVPVTEVILASVCGAGLGLVVTLVVQRKLLFRLAKRLRVSEKFGDEDLYMYFLNSPRVDWVWIRDERHHYTYQGRIESYSENNFVRELALTNVSVFRYSDEEPLYKIPGIYLSFPIGERIVIELPNNDGEDHGQVEEQQDSQNH